MEGVPSQACDQIVSETPAVPVDVAANSHMEPSTSLTQVIAQTQVHAGAHTKGRLAITLKRAYGLIKHKEEHMESHEAMRADGHFMSEIEKMENDEQLAPLLDAVRHISAALEHFSEDALTWVKALRPKSLTNLLECVDTLTANWEDTDTRRRCARTVAMFSWFKGSRTVMLRLGLVNLLAKFVTYEHPLIWEQCACAFAYIFKDASIKTNAQLLCTLGAVVRMCSSHNPTTGKFCAVVLLNMAHEPENRFSMVLAGATVGLLALAQHLENFIALQNVAAAIDYLAEEEKTLDRMISDGAVRALCTVAMHHDETVWYYMCKGVSKISGSVNSRQRLLDEGAAERLITIITLSHRLETRSLAVVALGNLTTSCDRPTLMRLGLVEAIAALLSDTQDFKVRRYCACCICNLAKSLECRERLLDEPIWSQMLELTAFDDKLAKRQCVMYFGYMSSLEEGRRRLCTPMMVCMLTKTGLQAAHDHEAYKDIVIATYGSFALSALAQTVPGCELLMSADPCAVAEGVVQQSGHGPLSTEEEMNPITTGGVTLSCGKAGRRGNSVEWAPVPDTAGGVMQVTAITVLKNERLLLGGCISRSAHDSIKTNTFYRFVVDGVVVAETNTGGTKDWENTCVCLMGVQLCAEPGEHIVELQYRVLFGAAVWPHDGAKDGIGEQHRSIHAVRIAPACCALEKWSGDSFRGSSLLWNPLAYPMETQIETQLPGEQLLVMVALSRVQHDSDRSNVEFQIIVDRDTEDEQVIAHTNTGGCHRFHARQMQPINFHGLATVKPGIHKICVEYKQNNEQGYALFSHDKKAVQERMLSAVRIAPTGGLTTEWKDDDLQGTATKWKHLPVPMTSEIHTSLKGDQLLVIADLSRVEHEESEVNVAFRLLVDGRVCGIFNTGTIENWDRIPICMQALTPVYPGRHVVVVQYMTQSGTVLWSHDPSARSVGRQTRRLTVVIVSPYEGLCPGGRLSGFSVQDDNKTMRHLESTVDANLTVTGELTRTNPLGGFTVTQQLEIGPVRQWEIRYGPSDDERGVWIRRDHIWYFLQVPDDSFDEYFRPTIRRAQACMRLKQELSRREYEGWHTCIVKAGIGEQELLESRAIMEAEMDKELNISVAHDAAEQDGEEALQDFFSERECSEDSYAQRLEFEACKEHFLADLADRPAANSGVLGWLYYMMEQINNHVLLHNASSIYNCLSAEDKFVNMMVRTRNGLEGMFHVAGNNRAQLASLRNVAVAMARLSMQCTNIVEMADRGAHPVRTKQF
jgi:hypothetical protein